MEQNNSNEMDGELFLKNFNQAIEVNFDDFLTQRGFKFTSLSLDKYSCSRIYKKGNQYIIVTASVHPKDNPHFWNILLGEGTTEMPESDWNKIALWHFMRRLENPSAKEFLFVDSGIDKLNESIQSAKNDLEKFGKSFLDGDLKLFYEVRSSINQKREPYKRSLIDADGNFNMIEDEDSKKLKEKFS